jgi:hypothetical protein
MSASPVVFSNEDFLVQEESWPVAVTAIEEKTWLDAIFSQLTSISGLAHNWDSYGGGPMSTTAAAAVLDLLSYFGTEFTVPEISLLASGGLQIEWEGLEYEVSFEVAPSRRISVMLAPIDEDPDVDEVGLSLSNVLDRYYDQLRDLLPRSDAL